MTTTTSKLGADMTDDEIMIEVREWLASRQSKLMQNDDWIALARALLARQPAAIDKQEAVAEVVMEPFDTWPRLKFVSVESMRNVEAGDMLYATPPAQTALTDDARDAIRHAALEEACAAIKAEDDRQHGNDYMLDSDDCIRVIRELLAAQSASGADHAN